MDPEPVIAADDPQFELALDRAYGRLHLGSTAPAPRYQMTQAGRPGHRPLAALAGLPALMGTKALAAAAVVTLAGTAVGVKTVVTGSPSPINWGQQVKTQVQTCKDQLRPDQHGIGQCVSTFAQ